MSVQASTFKFYLHDSIENCRLQLRGPLTVRELKELTGCWKTARSMLQSRQLIVDVSAVSSFDEPARKWIAEMVAEGALLIEKPDDRPSRPSRNGLLRRTVAALSRTAAQSPSSAQ